MSEGRSAWEDGRRAWERLFDWHRETRPDEDASLDALWDVARLRQVLDQAELSAVREARTANSSWAEIATALGISRQSAWEKWRELDDDAEVSGWEASVQTGVRSHGKRPRRVPDVVGLSWADARDALHKAGLAAVNADPDVAPHVLEFGVVMAQYPEPGTKLRPRSQVRLWVERGGGSAGVREPRRPHPTLRQDAGEIDIEAHG